MMSIDINSTVILHLHSLNFSSTILGISKNEVINLFKKNADLSKKNGSLQKFSFYSA